MKKERVVNIRFLFCVFIGLMLGIISSSLFLMNKVNLIVFIFSIVISFCVCVITWWYSKFSEPFNKEHRARHKVGFLIRWSGVGYLCAFVVGVVISIFPLNRIIQIQKFDGQVVVSGVVSDYVDEEETYTKFNVDDCVVVTNSGTHKIDFKVMVYTSSYVNLTLGDKITFAGNLDALDYSDEYDMTQLSQGIGYTIYAKQSDIVVDDGGMILKDKIHAEVKELLSRHLNQDNADISFAVLFGQKQGLSDNISNMFSYAGVSHILAVSGLHVGVLVSVLWFIIDKIKINRFVKVSLLGVILFFYCYLCAFSPSVCRASLMAMVLALCKILRVEYDSLSSLSIAGIIILAISPLSLFTISFQLSFMCLFAIITFAPAITRLFAKMKMPSVLASGLAMSIAVNIAILPICMNSFAEVSLLGIFANILVLPVFSVMFVLLFSVVLVSLIIKPLGILLSIPNMFLHLIKVVANYVSNIPLGVIKVFRISYILIFVIMLLLLTMHYWMCKRWWKGVLVSVLSISIALTTILHLIPTQYNCSLIFKEQYNSNVIVYVDNDDVTLIGSDISLDSLTFIMKDIKLKRIDNIVAYDLKLNNIDELLNIKQKFDVDKILLPRSFHYDEVADKLSNVEYFDNSYKINDLVVGLIDYKSETIAINISFDKSHILVPNLENNKTENKYLKDLCGSIDCIVTDGNNIWDDMSAIKKIINIETSNTRLLLTGELNEI